MTPTDDFMIEYDGKNFKTTTIEKHIPHGPKPWYTLPTFEPIMKYFIYGNHVTEEEWREHELIVGLSGLEDDV